MFQSPVCLSQKSSSFDTIAHNILIHTLAVVQVLLLAMRPTTFSLTFKMKGNQSILSKYHFFFLMLVP